MEFMSELLATVKERMKSKLVSSFVIAWLVYNYQLVLVIVGDGGYADKLYYIANDMKYDMFSVLSPSFLCPVGIALIYILFVPLMEGAVYYLQMIFVSMKKWLMMKADDIPPFSKSEFLQKRTELEQVISEKTEEIQSLTQKLADSEKELREENRKLIQDLHRQTIMRFISESGGYESDYNTITNLANSSAKYVGQNNDFIMNSPYREGLELFWGLVKGKNRHMDTDDVFMEKAELDEALNQHYVAKKKQDFILLLKAMGLIEDGRGWNHDKYLIMTEDRRSYISAFFRWALSSRESSN